MKHFYAYPKIEYSDNLATNIMVRGKVRDAVLKNSALYYKYKIDDSVRAEIISNKYYGSPNYVWAIYYANNITHPIFDWPMSQREFDKFIVQKYGSIERAHSKYSETGKINHESIHHYVLNEYHIIDKDTFVAANAILTKYSTYYTAYQQSINQLETKGYAVFGDYIIDKQTFLNLGALNPDSLRAVTFYEHEYSLNEKKRDIVVIDKSFLYEIVSEFENLF